MAIRLKKMIEEIKNCWNSHQKKFGFFAVVLVILVSVLLLVKIFEGMKNVSYIGKAPVAVNTITVSGKGEVVVKPDISTVSFSVIESDTDVSRAQQKVNDIMDKVMTYLKNDSVIEEKDIKTTSYGIVPQYIYPKVSSSYYYYPESEKVLTGYEVSQYVELKIRDISKSGSIVANLGKLGVKNMSGISFSIDKEDEFIKEARDKAIKQARDEAKKLAKSLGVRLGDIVGYSEGGYYPMYAKAMETSGYGRGGADVSDAVLPTGENTITSNISITYEIR